MTAPRTTRRGVLALAGGVALAGCGDLDVPGTGPAKLDAAAVRAVAAEEAPVVPETFPVRLGESTLSARLDRVRAVLDDVPRALGPNEVPNGVVRERLLQRVDRATEHARAATDAASQREGLAEARHARESATSAAATWRATAGDLTREAVAAEADGLRERVSALRGRVDYVADDPVRAAVVHAALEGFLDHADSRVTPSDGGPRERRGVLGVGELAGRHERARALLDDSGHLHDRFLDSLDGRRAVGDRLERAATAATEELRAAAAERSLLERNEASSYVDRDVEGTPAEWALSELVKELTWGRWDREAAARSPARALVAAADGFAALAAFDAVRSRVAEGDGYRIGDAEDVRAQRRAAVDGIQSADDSPAEPVLVAEVLPDVADRVVHADDRLSEEAGTVTAASLARPVGVYAMAAEKARALPAASERVAGRLRP